MSRREELERLRDAVLAGEYHREAPRPAKFNALYHELERIFEREDTAKFAPVIKSLKVCRLECADRINTLIAQEPKP